MAAKMLVAVLILASCTGLGHAAARTPPIRGQIEPPPLHPSIDVAAERGPQIFNAVFDSLRRYGSAVHPNGMSFFLATVPAGVLFHHGNGRNATPTSLDWLAYEIEHAEMFARNRFGRRPGGPGGSPGEGPGEGPGELPSHSSHHDDVMHRTQSKARLFGHAAPQMLLGDQDDDPDEESHGWLHTYWTTRALQFLYIDGMSGDKGDSGVIDTQDYILRASGTQPTSRLTRGEDAPKPTTPPGPPGEFARAEDICKLCAEWGLQGVIRTEGAGTEIIKCDFFDGLEQVQSLQRAGGDGPGGGGGGGQPPGRGGVRPPPGRGPPGHGPPGHRFPDSGEPFNFENSFRDVGGGRTVLDYASMVSAFFFPVNLTNPDPPREGEGSYFPRLVFTSAAERAAIQAYLARVVAERRSDDPAMQLTAAVPSWRDVGDLVVRRYGAQLVELADANKTNTTADFAKGIRSLLNVFTDYSVPDAHEREDAARQRCTAFYLPARPKLAMTTHGADRFLYAAFEAVNAEICRVLFDAANTVTNEPEDDDKTALRKAQASLKQLVAYLDWSVFERK